MRLESQLLLQLKENKPVILVTVYTKSGSVPRHPGAKMIVAQDEAEAIIGTIGGGRVENNAIVYAKKFFDNSDQAHLIEYNLAPGTKGKNIDMVCGGRVSILIEKILPTEENISLFSIFEEYAEAHKKGVWVIDMTEIESHKKVIRSLVAQESEKEQFPQELITEVFYDNKTIKSATPVIVDGKTFFVDPFMHTGTVVLVGAGHVAAEVAKLAYMVDFEVVVVDDRPEFSSKERFPMASTISVVDTFDKVFDDIHVHNDCYVVILTRGHIYDQMALEESLKTDAIYIGMIGSKRKKDTIFKNLLQKGITDKQLKAVYSPIGLSIGAESPTEIGLSIVGELIMERAK